MILYLKIKEVADIRKSLLLKIQLPNTGKFLEVEAQSLELTYRLNELSILRSQILSQKTELAAKYIGEEAARNWKEEQADEVGMELYMRTGFARDPMQKTFINMKNAIPSSAPTSPEAAESQTEICNRGYSSHPALCWRIKTSMMNMSLTVLNTMF